MTRHTSHRGLARTLGRSAAGVAFVVVALAAGVAFVVVALAAGAAEPDAEADGPPRIPAEWDRRVGSVASPGALARAHADLEGITRCAECHTWLSDTPDAPCLACHDAIADRLRDRAGHHGELDAPCAGCHPDHRGVEADLLGLDRDGFNHDQALFHLRGAHAEVPCDDCHVGKRPDSEPAAFHSIGIPHARCSDCHGDPHADRLRGERPCAACHTDAAWDQWLPSSNELEPDGRDRRGFDHDRDTRYALDPIHAPVACTSCHSEGVEEPPARNCRGCHPDAKALLSGRFGGSVVAADPHVGELTCAECHPSRTAGGRLHAYAETCRSCHPDSYGALLATQRALLDAALVEASARKLDARERRLLARLARSGLHHAELAEALARSLGIGEL